MHARVQIEHDRNNGDAGGEPVLNIPDNVMLENLANEGWGDYEREE